MRDNAWVHKIDPSANLTVDHIIEFVDLWIRLEQFQLRTDVDDDISWICGKWRVLCGIGLHDSVPRIQVHYHEQNCLESLGPS